MAMMSFGIVFLAFVLGFGVGITTHMLAGTVSDNIVSFDAAIDRPAHEHGVVSLDPFPLPSCTANRTSAVYILYGLPVPSLESQKLFSSVKTLLDSNFPGKVRIVIDRKVNETIRETIDPKHKYLLDQIEFNVVPLPDLNGKELIPHSNKIRALQAAAFVHGDDSNECTVSLDTDTYIHRYAPWSKFFSTLQLHDVAVARDCWVGIADMPEFLEHWMPNTGVLALRNTPRTRLVLRDWLDHFVPCNATHVSTCTPGTDQYPFIQLVAKHAVRLYHLENSWNCRLTPREIDAGIEGFPVYSVSVLSKDEYANTNETAVTCGGTEFCHILHGHWLNYD